MKFLHDQEVYGSTARFLLESVHDAVPVAKIGLSQASDSNLLDRPRARPNLCFKG